MFNPTLLNQTPTWQFHRGTESPLHSQCPRYFFVSFSFPSCKRAGGKAEKHETMERKRAVKKAGGDATASAEERGDPQTQGEEAPLQLKPCPSERTWQGLLVYSRKALYERKHSLQSPRLKRRKSRRSLLLPQNQLVAKREW